METRSRRASERRKPRRRYFSLQRTVGWMRMDGRTDERNTVAPLRERANGRAASSSTIRERERAWQRWQRGQTGEDLYPDSTRFGSATLAVSSPRDHMTRAQHVPLSTRYSADIGPISSGVRPCPFSSPIARRRDATTNQRYASMEI